MPALKEIFARYDIEFNDSKLRRGNEQLDRTDRKISRLDRTVKGLRRTFSGLGTAIGSSALLAGGVQAFRGAFDFVNDMVGATRDVATYASSLGIASEALVRFQELAIRQTWIENPNDTLAIKGLQQIAMSFSEASGNLRSERARFLREGGLTNRDIRELAEAPPEVQFEATQEILHRLSPGRRAFVGPRLMGTEAYLAMGGFAQKTREERRVEYERAAVGAPRQVEFQKAAEENEQALAESLSAIREFKAALALGLMPVVLELTPHIAELTKVIAENPLIVKSATIGTGILTFVGGLGLLAWAFKSIIVTLGLIKPFLTTVFFPFLLGFALGFGIPLAIIKAQSEILVGSLESFGYSLLEAAGVSEEYILSIQRGLAVFFSEMAQVPVIGRFFRDLANTTSQRLNTSVTNRDRPLQDEGFRSWIRERWPSTNIKNIPTDVLGQLRGSWQNQMVQQKREGTGRPTVQNTQHINLTVNAAGETDPQRLAQAIDRRLRAQTRSVHGLFPNNGVA